MKNRNTVILALASMTLMTGLFTTATLAGPPKKSPGKKAPGKKTTPKADPVADGKKVYEKYGCANCHAIAGKGGNSGPDLSKVGADAKHDVKFFEAKVKNPKASNPDSTMPAYEDSIKGKDLTNLATYLKSLK